MQESKFIQLLDILRNMQSVVLSFSGGVDSSLLLKAIKLSGTRVLAVTADSEIVPRHDVLLAKIFAEELGIEHRVIKIEVLSQKKFVRNTPERCFFCKDKLFKYLTDIACSEEITFVVEGSNSDDTSDFRPGRKASEKYQVRSPLREAGLSKREIREISQGLGLSTWDRPSASCLATRFPYGQKITKEALKRVEQAEDFLRSFGFKVIRVRDHNSIARIEVEGDKIDMLLTPDIRERVSEKLKSLGYIFVTLDLNGYRSGSLNHLLDGTDEIS